MQLVFNLHIDKARKTHSDKQLHLITHFTKQTLTLVITVAADVESNGTVIKLPKTERAILLLNLNSRSMVATFFGFVFNVARQRCHTPPT